MNLESELNDQNQNRTRFMGQMVLCAFEQSLGRFIVERWSRLTSNDSTLVNILSREPLLSTKPFSREQVETAVVASYLKELFDLAFAASAETTECECLKEIYAFAINIELFDIRNSASHPNRPFFPHYWYRLAAFASDPRIQRLGMWDVLEKLEMAIAGRIEAPPASWLQNRSELPNNLPGQFEHSATGLVGRDNERVRLWSIVKNPRKHFVAIIAPGGNGKTALALDFLDEVCSSAEGRAISDGIIYASFKRTSLTAKGVVTNADAPTDSDFSLEREIARAFSIAFAEPETTYKELREKYKNQRIVLFLDNAETLLLRQSDALSHLESGLPATWRLLVTSRIGVDDAIAFPLGPLSKIPAKRLVRYYIGSCGYPQPTDDLVDAIVVGARYNPLAMKLIVDTYVAGRDVSESIAKAAQDTTEFSFSGLLDVLPKETISVMEALYVDEDVSRSTLKAVLQLDTDQIAGALNQLCRTSLATRSYEDDTETIILNEQVRELLRTNPKNLEIRNQVERNLRARRAKFAQTKQVSGWHGTLVVGDVPESTPAELALLYAQVLKFAYKTKANLNLTSLYQEVMDCEDEFKSLNLYWRTRGILLWHLQDRTAAVDCIEKSLALEPTNLPSLRLHAFWMIEEQRPDEAKRIYEKLLELGAGDSAKVGDEFASAVVAGHLNSLTYLGQFEDALSKTENWHRREDIGLALATVRIGCFKRWAENAPNGSPEKERRTLQAVNVFEQAANYYGLTSRLQNRGRELVKEICYQAKSLNASDAFLLTTGKFFARYLRDIVNAADPVYMEAQSALSIFHDAVRRSNSSQDSAGSFATPSAEELATTFVARGYILVKVVQPPSYVDIERSSFRFGVDEAGEEYFLHQSQLSPKSEISWLELRGESIVAVLRKLSPKGGNQKKWTAQEFHIVSIAPQMPVEKAKN